MALPHAIVVRNAMCGRQHGETQVARAAGNVTHQGSWKPWEHPCAHCGKPFTRGINQAQRRFCQNSCRQKAARRRKLGLSESLMVEGKRYDLINTRRR